MALELWMVPPETGGALRPPPGVAGRSRGPDLGMAVEFGWNGLTLARADVMLSMCSARGLLERCGGLGMEARECEWEMGRPEASLFEVWSIWSDAVRAYARAMEKLARLLGHGPFPGGDPVPALRSILSAALRGIRPFALDQEGARASPAGGFATPVGQLFYVGGVLAQRLARAREEAALGAGPGVARRRYMGLLERMEGEALGARVPDFSSLHRELEQRSLELDLADALSEP